MNVYLRVEDGVDLLGRTSLEDERDDTVIVDLDLPGTGEAVRLTYDVRTLPCLTSEGRLAEERAVLLSLGQTPDFLPGWQAAE